MEAVLPRALGPAAYGNYSFSTALFQNYTNFLDMGTSTCLSTHLAKRPHEFGLAAFYIRIGVLMLLLSLLAGASMHLPGIGAALMPGVPLWMALPAAFWAYITWVGRVTRGMNDALGITRQSELVRVGINLCSALALLALFFCGVLDLPVLFTHQYLSLGCMGAGFILILRTHWRPFADDPEGRRRTWRLPRRRMSRYIQEFRDYSAPLFVTALFSALILSAERWLLQYFEGSEQQGYFSLSQKVGMACFLFVTALTPLLMRELAVAHGNNDPRAMARLLDRYAPMMYAVSAWLASFTMVEAPAVVRLFGGESFAQALLPVQIMALYPIHQGYGQVASAVFYASGETRLLRNLTLLSLVLGFALSWILLAPPSLGGLRLGATGLALKMTLTQVISVNLLFLFCRKTAPFNYARNLMHQCLCPLALIGIALSARYISHGVGLGDSKDFIRFFASGILYCFLSALLALGVPFIFGLAPNELKGFAFRAKNSLAALLRKEK